VFVQVASEEERACGLVLELGVCFIIYFEEPPLPFAGVLLHRSEGIPEVLLSNPVRCSVELQGD